MISKRFFWRRKSMKTYRRAASIKIATTDAVRDVDVLNADMISITKSAVHIADFRMFVMRNVRGLRLLRASRTISVIVRMRHAEIKAIQTGPTLQKGVSFGWQHQDWDRSSIHFSGLLYRIFVRITVVVAVVIVVIVRDQNSDGQREQRNHEQLQT